MQDERFLPLTGLALGFALLALVGLWRPKDRRELGIWRIVAPIGLPLIGALILGAITDYRLDWVLNKAYIGRPLAWPAPVSYVPIVYDRIGAYCGRVLALDSIWTAGYFVILGSSLALAVPAARAAWRAGKRGHRLGEGWSAAALGCFALGALALLLTRPHARDRASTIASCEGRQLCDESNWQWTWARLLENASSSELQALQAPDCVPWHCTAHAPELPTMANAVYQLSATGTIAPLHGVWSRSVEASLEGIDTNPQQFRIRIAEEFEKAREIAEQRGETFAPVVLLYADVRTPTDVFAGYLKVMRGVGVVEIVVLGENTITGELATVGPWRYRVACPIGRIRFDGANRWLDEFATWGEVGTAAASENLEPLRLAL